MILTVFIVFFSLLFKEQFTHNNIDVDLLILHSCNDNDFLSSI